MSVLASSSRLTNIFALCFRHLFDGLFVGDLGFANVGLYLKLALHAIYHDFEMKLSHTRDNRLPSLYIRSDLECRIFFREALERNTHLFLVGFGTRLNTKRYHRISKCNL